MDGLGLTTRKDDARVHEANMRELAASLAWISLNGHGQTDGQTEVEHIAKQTVLACFADSIDIDIYTGKQSTGISLEDHTQRIEVRRKTLADAQRRRQSARHDVQPAVVLELQIGRSQHLPI